MASQQKIQEYLQRHKIGTLFEELMGKIVVDQPEDPIRHLIAVLQTKLDHKSEKAIMSKSMAGPVPAHVRSGSPERMKLAASYSGEKLALEKERQYDKPWLANSRPLKSRTDSIDGTVSGKTGQKPAEKAGIRMDLSNFDDIFEDVAPVKKPNAAASSNKPEELKNPAFTRFQNSVTHIMIINRVQEELMRQASEEELLSAEVPISIRTVMETIIPDIKGILLSASKATVSVKSPVLPVSRYNKGPKADALSHKKMLEEIVLKEGQLRMQQQNEMSDDSGYDDVLIRDSAVELLEDVELLKQEGATNVKASGYKIRHVPTMPTAPAVDVKVSICARCAKFLDGDVNQATPLQVSSHGQLPNYSKETEPFSRPVSGRGAPSPAPPVSSGRHSPIEGFLGSSARHTPSPGLFQSDDEEFESVSQVTGPRHPVWQDEDEAMTPRKGVHMLLQSGTANKVRHPYSRDEADPGSKSQHKTLPGGTPRNSSAVPASRQNSGTAAASAAGKRNAVQLSDDENILSSLIKNSNQWVVPDYDTDGSTVYVSGGARSTTKNYKPRAY